MYPLRLAGVVMRANDHHGVDGPAVPDRVDARALPEVR
jgi:hypothetical protein